MTSSTQKNGLNPVTVALFVAVGLVTLLGNAGCDQLGNLLSWGGLVNPWYTSAMGLPAFPTLYDPTNDIQDVIAYRGSVMDSVADNFTDFIMQ